jgi:hypothetical protein
MKKLEALKQLLEIVKNKQLAAGSYCSDGKTCIVGHIMMIGGLTFDELEEVQTGNLYNDWYSIDSIIKYAKKTELEKDLVSPAITACGFNLDSEDDISLLSKMQVTNDGKEKQAVIAFLEETIAKMEENENE